MTKMNELAGLGQSVWIDTISRAFIQSGELSELIERGLRGLTSNPSIFEKAIAHSQDYDADLARLALQGATADEIFVALAAEDIQQAAGLFRPLYDRDGGRDGYVSLEVNPRLANATAATLSEARRLWSLVARPNLMIKIPATPQGLPAITAAIADGINVNVTLIFSLERYQAVMEAYLAGLEQRFKAGKPLGGIHSVASFFVSRVDSKVDKRLEEIQQQGGLPAQRAAGLKGQAAVANARLAYSLFRQVFESERFERLKAAGANLQRPLWASTSTKSPAYSDILYVQELIGAHTVNTMPLETLQAFEDHGQARLSIEEGLEEAKAAIQGLEHLGISMNAVTQELESEGVAAFAKSFEALLGSLESKRAQFMVEEK